MYKTKQEIIKRRISFVEDLICKDLPAKIQKEMQGIQRSGNQSRLNFLMEDEIFYSLIKAIKEIKQYAFSLNNIDIIKKLRKKLCEKNKQPKQKFESIAEIIVVDYYMQKFNDNKNIKSVIWERKVIGSDSKPGNIDISISLTDGKIINIDVTCINWSKKELEFNHLGNKVGEKIQSHINDFNPTKYYYLVDLIMRDNDILFPEKEIPDLLNYITKIRKKGIGNYHYNSKNQKKSVEIEVRDIKELDTKNEQCIMGWTYFWGCKNALKIKSKIKEKAKSQFPPKEINIICFANEARLRKTDYEDAYKGQEAIYTYYNKAKRKMLIKKGREKNGAIEYWINDQHYSPVHAVIFFSRDYTKKEIITWESLDNTILDIIQ